MNQMAAALLKAGLIDEKQLEVSERRQDALHALEGRQAKSAPEAQPSKSAQERLVQEPVSVTGALSGGTPATAQA